MRDALVIVGSPGQWILAPHRGLAAMAMEQVTATAIEDATIVVQPYNFSFTARATWSAAGRDHSDIVRWSDQVKAGDQQLIWVNAEGVHVRPPSSPSRAGGDAVGIALSVWFGVAGAQCRARVRGAPSARSSTVRAMGW